MAGPARTDLLPGARCWTQPTLAGRRLFVRNHDRAVCVYLGDPADLPAAVRARARPTSEVPATPPVAHVPWPGEVLAAGGGQAAALPDADAGGDPVGPIASYSCVPTPSDLVLWFVACAGLLAAAALLAHAVPIVATAKRPAVPPADTAWLFPLLALLLGAAGTPLLALATGRFICTAPAALFPIYAETIAACLAARRDPAPRAALRARLLVLILVGLCGAWCAACQFWFLPAGPAFLVGLLPAFPLVLAYSQRPIAASAAGRVAWFALAFAVEFWFSALVILWRMGG
ncbi:MAG: hypothetical protein HZA54_07645 [Planctomycetes bacterium]|nr:hypothetical protein [Planctomycetota bacterium]